MWKPNLCKLTGWCVNISSQTLTDKKRSIKKRKMIKRVSIFIIIYTMIIILSQLTTIKIIHRYIIHQINHILILITMCSIPTLLKHFTNLKHLFLPKVIHIIIETLFHLKQRLTSIILLTLLLLRKLTKMFLQIKKLIPIIQK